MPHNTSQKNSVASGQCYGQIFKNSIIHKTYLHTIFQYLSILTVLAWNTLHDKKYLARAV